MTDTPPPTLDVATLAARIEWLEKLFKFDDDVAMITAPNDPVTGGKCILEVASFDAMNAELRASREETARLREAALAVVNLANKLDGNPICPCCFVQRWNRAEHTRDCALMALDRAAKALEG